MIFFLLAIENILGRVVVVAVMDSGDEKKISLLRWDNVHYRLTLYNGRKTNAHVGCTGDIEKENLIQ